MNTLPANRVSTYPSALAGKKRGCHAPGPRTDAGEDDDFAYQRSHVILQVHRCC